MNTAKISVSDAPPVEVISLSKRYGRSLWANREVSFTANRGEILAILGPNGAGKTTLVRQITTELLPSSGEVRVFGHNVVTQAQRVKALMGIVPQAAQVYEYLTVHQAFRIFGKLRGLGRSLAESRAQELMRDLHLEDHRDVTFEKLSGGLQRRVLAGISILTEPPLLVLDEPTTGLDPEARRDLWTLLRRCRDSGATILMTTHYMEEAEALCNRVGIIQGGRLLALDTVANLKAALGYEFKLTHSSGEGEAGHQETLYGLDDEMLVGEVRSMGIRQYSVARTNLEDVYFALTGGKRLSQNDDAD